MNAHIFWFCGCADGFATKTMGPSPSGCAVFGLFRRDNKGLNSNLGIKMRASPPSPFKYMWWALIEYSWFATAIIIHQTKYTRLSFFFVLFMVCSCVVKTRLDPVPLQLEGKKVTNLTEDDVCLLVGMWSHPFSHLSAYLIRTMRLFPCGARVNFHADLF